MQEMKPMGAVLYKVYLFLTISLFLLLAGSAVYLLMTNYDSLIAIAVNSLHKNGIEQKLRNEVFTRHHFEVLQRGAYAILIIATFLLWLSFRYRFYIINLCRFSVQSVLHTLKSTRQVFKNNSSLQNRAVFALMTVIALFSLYHIIHSYITYDEMWSYNYYTANHFYYSFFTYSGYPFFEMTTHVLKGLPLPMKFNLRFSSFLFGMAACILLYACLRKRFQDHFTAMAGVVAFAFMPVTPFYMVIARGVIHELFFAVAGIFSLLFWIECPDQKRFLATYFFVAVLGIYAMPTHIILVFFMLVYGAWHMLKNHQSKMGLFILVNVLVFVFSFMLYAPMLVVTGISVFKGVSEARVGFSDVISRLPFFAEETLRYYTGYTQAGIIILVIAMVVMAGMRNKIQKNLQPVLIIAIGLPVAVIIFYLVTGIMYPGRSLAFGAMVIPLLTCLFVKLATPFLNKYNHMKNAAGVVALSLIVCWNVFFYFSEEPVYKNIAAVSKLFINKGIVTCYDNSSNESDFFYYYPGIEYYYRLEHKTVEFTLAAKNSMRYKPLLPADKYDCIIIDVNSPGSNSLNDYHQLYMDPAGKFSIFIRNDLK